MNTTRDCPKQNGRRERGQVLIMLALFLIVLLLFVGLGIDLGFAYITQARLSKALDAAALAGMNNYYQGTTQAVHIAQATFAANFAPNTNNVSPGYVIGTPSPSITFSNAGNNVVLNVSATATNKTFFLGLLNVGGMINLNTFAVGQSAQATRLPLIMTLVLDRSGSMDPATGSTKGGMYLPSAVDDFIGDFIPGVDQAAVISFASTWTNDVPMTGAFNTAVPKAVGGISWGGGTCAICGLTNAMLLENSIGSTDTSVKAVVFFTDGLANMIESSISCPSPAGPWNFGGRLPNTPNNPVAFFHTNTTIALQGTSYCDAGGHGCCSDTGTYTSYDGTHRTFTMENVVIDATNRCINVARQLQASGTYVFCVGLDNANDGDVPDPDFLQTVANDPTNPNPAHYDPSLPAGVAFVTGNGSDLAELFQLIAGQIQFRLTR
ncbi:MAG TPA: VWA domain-containing protein [Verrucomicrobiae bacterium]|nr:VWA domain-containing protein [Verrucomicrobiae bacterium]